MTLSTRIKDLPNRERPRERLAELGPDALSDVELIAILLRTGLQGKSAVDVGAELVRQFGTLSALSQATLEELQTIKGIGRDKAIALQSAFTLARFVVLSADSAFEDARRKSIEIRLANASQLPWRAIC